MTFIMIVRVVAGVAVLAGFVWLLGRLLSRMINSTSQSPPGARPTDRTVGDKDHDIL